MTVTEAAPDRLHADTIRINYIKLSLTGLHVGWTIYTCLRLISFESKETNSSPSANYFKEPYASGRPSRLAIASARAGLDVPAKIVKSSPIIFSQFLDLV